MPTHLRKLLPLAIAAVALAGLLLLLARPVQSRNRLPGPRPLDPAPLFQTVPLTSTTLYMPFVPVNLGPAVELQWLQTFDAQGDLQAAFLPGESFDYVLTAVNNRPFPLTIALSIHHQGPCGSTPIYTGPLTLQPGTTQHVFPAAGESCQGIYVAAADFTYRFLSGTHQNFFVVNPASVVTVNEQHGFDACHPPTVAEMQVWWDTSPYYVYNLYLGGVLFACADEPLDPFWVHQVAAQGWEFILSWVGPQAPCTGYRERMSWDLAAAYQEGRAEAWEAAEAAERLGLLGDRVIYYDVEGYASATFACRNAVSAFIEGWTDQLHDLGLRAGAYGGACSSYLADWASNSPPPDDVWIAHWTFSEYDPEATVWDAPCVSNNLWSAHQRIKQYAGGHDETWGEVTVNIDSDVLDGEVTSLPFGGAAGPGESPPATLASYGIPWQDVGLFGPGGGWARTDTQLWVSVDGGVRWLDRSPDFQRLLDVAFRGSDQAWAVGWRGAAGEFSLAVSGDGGARWAYAPLTPLAAGDAPVAAASLSVRSPDQIQVTIRRASGSNFFLGEVYTSRDSGRSWSLEQEFASGAVESLWGLGQAPTWDERSPADLPAGAVAADFFGDRYGWVVVQEGACAGEKGTAAGLACIRTWRLLATVDAGATWTEIGLE